MRKWASLWAFLATLCQLHAGGQSFEENKREGAEWVQISGGFRVWTKRIGEGPVKVLLLHGGPGCSHEYLECFEEFFPKEQFQLIYYDQLGSYLSDHPEDPSLWTIDRFCEEVEEVRRALGLENFYLYGHSWGGMLSIEYALQHPEHLKGLIISNMTASIPAYGAYLEHLRKQLPEAVQEALSFYEERGEYFHPEYEKIMRQEIYAKHLCRLDVWPDSLERAFSHLNAQVYQTMQGPNEFVVTGNFKAWDRWSSLSQIQVPTLLMVGRHDTMSVEDIEKMGRLIPMSTVKVCENGSHCSFYDDPEAYFEAIHSFFKKEPSP